MSKNGSWTRGSGGCYTSAGGAGDMSYPCDDEYEHTVTKERIKIHSTYDRHIDLPNRVGAPEELYDMSGVKQ